MFKNKYTLLVILVSILSIGVMACGGGEEASQYPDDTIELIVPWGAGGDTDVIARIVNKYLEEELDTSISVVNMGGGGGAIGAQEALNADPDGYTLLAGHDSIAVSYLMGQTDFDYFDFEPISLMSSVSQVLATNPNNPWDTMEDVFADLEQDPGSVSFGATIGSTTHVIPLGIMDGADVEFNLVSYEDTAERTQALLGNHVDIVPTTIPAADEYINAGEIKILGILSEERNDALPDVPTLKEQGVDFTFGTNRGYFFPEGTPEEAIQTMEEALANVAENPGFIEEIEQMGVDVNYLNTEEYEEYLQNDLVEMETILDNQGVLDSEE